MNKIIITSITFLSVALALFGWISQKNRYELEAAMLEDKLHTSVKFMRVMDDYEKIAQSLQEAKLLFAEISRALPVDGKSVKEDFLQLYTDHFNRKHINVTLQASNKVTKDFYYEIHYSLRLEGSEENIISALKIISENAVGEVGEKERFPWLTSIEIQCRETSSHGTEQQVWMVMLKTYTYRDDGFNPSDKPKKTLAGILKVPKSKVWLFPYSRKISILQKKLGESHTNLKDLDDAEKVYSTLLTLTAFREQVQRKLAILKALTSNLNHIDYENVLPCDS